MLLSRWLRVIIWPLKSYVSGPFLFLRMNRLLLVNWGLRIMGLLLLSLILSCLLGLFLRRNQLGAIFWRALVLGIALLVISIRFPPIVSFPLSRAMSAAPVDESPSQGISNQADPLDLSYRPKIDTTPRDYPGNVWVTDSLQKVHQDTGSPGSVHWAILSAAKNEFGDFQVHVQAGAGPISLSVTASDLVNSRTGASISHLTNVIVYREAYLNITMPSNVNGTLGLTPDILIPAIDPYYHQSRNAFPYTISPHQNQSVWIDVLVPPGISSGYYSGTVTVSDGGNTLATIPVLLSVWNFTLPSTATLKSAFRLTGYGLCDQAYGVETNCGAYPGAHGNWVSGSDLARVDQAVMFLDHRVSLANAPLTTPYDNNWDSFNKLYGPLFDGTTAHTKTMLAGAQLTNIEFNGGGNATRQQWATNFQAHGWMPKVYDYTCDEPPENCSWADILPKAAVNRAVSPPIRTLVTTTVHKAAAQNVLSSIDILSPVVNEMDGLYTANQRSTYSDWLASPGHHLWWYQACDVVSTCDNGKPGNAKQTFGSYMIDSTPVANRVFQWLAYMYGIETELYYFTDFCWGTPCGYPARAIDPWTSIYIFGGNGDGTLQYPGTPAKIGGTAPIPLPSIRLEHIRDGMQDYEYLAALDRAGYANFARATAESFIANPYTFSDNPQAMMNARRALGNKLHLLSVPPASGLQPTGEGNPGK
jgi:hypothetical protein